MGQTTDCPSRELCEAERSSGAAAAEVLLKALGWSSGGLHQAACQLVERLAAACKECGSKQAQIDRLMLEYCPEEMTPEQIKEYGDHQVVAPDESAPQEPSRASTGAPTSSEARPAAAADSPSASTKQDSIRHERRVVGHASGWQEQMDTCVCGQPWPCSTSSTSPTTAMPDDAYIGLKGTTDALLRDADRRIADRDAKLDAIADVIGYPRESWRIAGCDALAHAVGALQANYIKLRDTPSATGNSESVLEDARRFNWLGLHEYGAPKRPNAARICVEECGSDFYYRDQLTGFTSSSWREVVSESMHAIDIREAGK